MDGFFSLLIYCWRLLITLGSCPTVAHVVTYSGKLLITPESCPTDRLSVNFYLLLWLIKDHHLQNYDHGPLLR